MSFIRLAPEPNTPLARHRILAPTAAVRVSPLCLGAMNFGDEWKDILGECDKKTAFEMMDYFYESGGNFIDTANHYQNEESESWVGEWMEQRGVRDQMVIATKFTTNYVGRYGKAGVGAKLPHIMSNYSGNSHKSLHLSLEASLKKLRTSYIDLLYFHWWDFTTSVEELVQAMNHMVQAGKVLYLGVSDTPAWVVSKANQYARDHGLKQFSVYQGMWSAAERDFERDILPMCEAEGMSMAPWGALGRGKFRSEEQRNAGAKTEGRQMGDPTDKDIKVSIVLEKIAKAKDTLITSVALAYVMHASPYRVFPIVGGRKVEHLKGNIEALKLDLSQEEITEIEKAVDFDYGFPMKLLTSAAHASTRLTAGDCYLTKWAVHLDVPPKLSSLPGAGH